MYTYIVCTYEYIRTFLYVICGAGRKPKCNVDPAPDCRKGLTQKEFQSLNCHRVASLGTYWPGRPDAAADSVPHRLIY